MENAPDVPKDSSTELPGEKNGSEDKFLRGCLDEGHHGRTGVIEGGGQPGGQVPVLRKDRLQAVDAGLVDIDCEGCEEFLGHRDHFLAFRKNICIM